MERSRILSRSTLFVALLIVSASPGCAPDRSNSPTSGSLHVLVAESVAPAAVRQVEAFMTLYGPNGANVRYLIVPSKDAVARFISDTFRVALVADSLSASEMERVRESNRYLLDRIAAYDGIAVVTHPDNPVDSLTTSEVGKILTGTLTRWERVSGARGARGKMTVVTFDSGDAIQYLRERLLAGNELREDRQRVESSHAVLQRVREDKGAVGFVSTSWTDSAGTGTRSVRIALTEEESERWYDIPPGSRGKAYDPHPAHVLRGYYPFRRSIRLLGRADQTDIVAGFNSFILNKDGQRIFFEEGMLPATQPVRLRASE